MNDGAVVSKRASVDRISLDAHLQEAASQGARMLSMPGVSSSTTDDIEGIVMSIFERADADHSNALDFKEFKSCIASIGSQLHLQQADTRQLMSLADTSDDGLIQYSEFLPIAIQLLSMIAAKSQNAAVMSNGKARAASTAEYLLVHGMTPTEVQQRLHDAFAAADTDMDGLLSREELQAALQGSPLGLSRKDINLLMAEVSKHVQHMTRIMQH